MNKVIFHLTLVKIIREKLYYDTNLLANAKTIVFLYNVYTQYFGDIQIPV